MTDNDDRPYLPEKIGNRIRLIAAANDISVSEMARQIDVPRSRLSNAVNGVSAPSPCDLRRIMDRYRVTADFVLYGRWDGLSFAVAKALKLAKARGAAQLQQGSVLRAIVYPEQDMFVAQCLERDICARGRTIDEMCDALALTIAAELLECEKRGLDLSSIPPAPERFHDMWGAGGEQLEPKQIGGHTFQFVLVASAFRRR